MELQLRDRHGASICLRRYQTSRRPSSRRESCLPGRSTAEAAPGKWERNLLREHYQPGSVRRHPQPARGRTNMTKLTIVTDSHGKLVGAVHGHELSEKRDGVEAHVAFPSGHRLHKVD